MALIISFIKDYYKNKYLSSEQTPEKNRHDLLSAFLASDGGMFISGLITVGIFILILTLMVKIL